MIDEKFVDDFINEVESELKDLEKIEKTVESAIDAAKQEISLDEKIDESLVENVKNKALREGEKRVQHLKEKIEGKKYELYMEFSVLNTIDRFLERLFCI